MLGRIFTAGLLSIGLTLPTLADRTTITVSVKSSDKQPDAEAPFQGQRSAVDVALLLDTSNSMDGLISQAKNQLWTIVQEFSKARQHGQTPILRVALFEYGNTNLPASEGYIRQVVRLTDDLDELSEALFALRTNGGDEYCGQTIREALNRLDWTGEPNAYKAIFIAGNEPFTQGSVDYRDTCKQAIEAGVIVNTIHCGDFQAGVRGKWKHGAELAEGEYFNIDQDRREIRIICPQDGVILRLNAELNRTYLWFGEAELRGRFAGRQTAQDAAAMSESSSTLVNRAATKAGGLYRNASRDLVDAVADNEAVLTEIKAAHLPEPMQQMSADERRTHVEAMAAKRSKIQQQIAELNVQRERHLVAERTKLEGENQDDTLGDAVAKAIRGQLTDSGFELE